MTKVRGVPRFYSIWCVFCNVYSTDELSEACYALVLVISPCLQQGVASTASGGTGPSGALALPPAAIRSMEMHTAAYNVNHFATHRDYTHIPPGYYCFVYIVTGILIVSTPYVTIMVGIVMVRHALKAMEKPSENPEQALNTREARVRLRFSVTAKTCFARAGKGVKKRERNLMTKETQQIPSYSRAQFPSCKNSEFGILPACRSESASCENSPSSACFRRLVSLPSEVRPP